MHFLSVVFAVVAVILLFAKDHVIDKNTGNDVMKKIYDNSMGLGIASGVLAYIMYVKEEVQEQTTMSDSVKSEFPSIKSD